MEDRFWETKSLDDMSREEWEAICDGCAKCCLHKFIDDDDAVEAAPTDYMEHHETIHYTSIACDLLNTKTCSCTRYTERQQLFRLSVICPPFRSTLMSYSRADIR